MTIDEYLNKKPSKKEVKEFSEWVDKTNDAKKLRHGERVRKMLAAYDDLKAEYESVLDHYNALPWLQRIFEDRPKLYVDKPFDYGVRGLRDKSIEELKKWRERRLFNNG